MTVNDTNGKMKWACALKIMSASVRTEVYATIELFDSARSLIIRLLHHSHSVDSIVWLVKENTNDWKIRRYQLCVKRCTDHLGIIFVTACQRQGFCMPYHTRQRKHAIYYVLAVQPGDARAYLRSAQLCRFAPVAPHSFLASRSVAQPTDDPMEKLCSALNFCWLKKGVFEWWNSNGKIHTAPGYFLSWRQPARLFLEIFK